MTPVEVTVVRETVEIVQDSTVAVVELTQTEVVEVGLTGPQGPPGPQGPTGPGSTTGLIHTETPAGVIDGVSVDFTTAHAFLPGSTTLYLNGLAQEEPGDYNEMSSTVVRFVDAPLAGDTVRISYQEV